MPEIQPNLDWSRLPQSLLDLRDIIGSTAALELTRARGGTTLYIPRRVLSDHRLAGLIGIDALAKLVCTYGGSYLKLPKYDAIKRQMRERHILEMHGRGASTADIAREFDLSDRRVRQIIFFRTISG